MFYNYYESDEYQYDSCADKGACSLSPRVLSLQEVLAVYLKQLAYYTLELKKMGISNENIKRNIINIISSFASNLEYTSERFNMLLEILYQDLVESENLYSEQCKSKGQKPKILRTHIKKINNFNLNETIKQGEKELNKKLNTLSAEQKNLYEILFSLMKNVCLNLMELENFNKAYDEAYYAVLEVLSSLNKNITKKNILTIIADFKKIDYELSKQLRNARIEAYGRPHETEVSYSTRPNKAILVSGHSLKELEKLLDSTKDKDVDIYTHNGLISVYTYQKFKEYPHLQGQFGVGYESSLLDFATFPGAILITKNSLQNVEYLYRGRIFTTDNNVPKGIVKIEDSDFEPLIQSAKEARGFSKGKKRESVKIGYDYNKVIDDINKLIEKFRNGEYSELCIMGLSNKMYKKRIYFNKLLKSLPQKFFTIIFSEEKYDYDNVLTINAEHDFPLIYEIIELFNSADGLEKIGISVYLANCNNHVISSILGLKHLGINNIYLGECSPNIINPALLSAFKKQFGIKDLTIPQKYLKKTN